MKIERKMTGIYLSDEERTMLQSQAEAADQTMSAYVRSLIRQADRDRQAIRLPKKHRAVEYAQ